MRQEDSQSFVPAQKSAQLTKGFLFATAGISCVAIVSSLLQAVLLARIAGGGAVSASEAATNDAREQIIAILHLVLFLGAVVSFLVWFHRAHKNLPAIGARDLKYTPGWAVGGFFVPFLNLVRPFQVMREIWHGSDPTEVSKQNDSLVASPGGTPELLRWWWGLFLVSALLGNISMRWSFKSNPSLSELQTMTWIHLFSDLIEVPSALVAARVVRTVTSWQTEGWQLRRAVTQPSSAL